MHTERSLKNNNCSPETLTGGFNGLNTRLAFDIEILLPIYTYQDFDKMSIDQAFKTFKRDDIKVGYKLKLDSEIEYSDRIIISKILKLDENNQYGICNDKTNAHWMYKTKKLFHGQKLMFYSKLLIYMIILLTCLL